MCCSWNHLTWELMLFYQLVQPKFNWKRQKAVAVKSRPLRQSPTATRVNRSTYISFIFHSPSTPSWQHTTYAFPRSVMAKVFFSIVKGTALETTSSFWEKRYNLCNAEVLAVEERLGKYTLLCILEWRKKRVYMVIPVTASGPSQGRPSCLKKILTTWVAVWLPPFWGSVVWFDSSWRRLELYKSNNTCELIFTVVGWVYFALSCVLCFLWFIWYEWFQWHKINTYII